MLKKNRLTFKKWSENCPDNYLNKYYLIVAELSRITGKHEKAFVYYDMVIKSAEENGYIQNEAIGYELAGKYYFIRGNNQIARQYFKEAYDR